MTYLRGALVEFMPTGLIPIPNIIVFQYNPETMSHAWTQPPAPSAGPNQTTSNPLAVNGNPGESFTFTLSLDAADSIAEAGTISRSSTWEIIRVFQSRSPCSKSRSRPGARTGRIACNPQRRLDPGLPDRRAPAVDDLTAALLRGVQV